MNQPTTRGQVTEFLPDLKYRILPIQAAPKIILANVEHYTNGYIKGIGDERSKKSIYRAQAIFLGVFLTGIIIIILNLV